MSTNRDELVKTLNSACGAMRRVRNNLDRLSQAIARATNDLYADTSRKTLKARIRTLDKSMNEARIDFICLDGLIESAIRPFISEDGDT